MATLPYLNLGCGYRYHPDWTNVDFIQTGPGVLAYNLLQGIPFGPGEFRVVYHSHVLEHFPKEKAPDFLQECYRVLRTGGIIRVAVPDLAQIVAHYQRLFTSGLQNPQDHAIRADYEWIMLELYDQAVRHQSGGEMARCLLREHVPNLAFVYERIGMEGQSFREHHLASQLAPTPSQLPSQPPSLLEKWWFVARHPLKFAKGKLKKWLCAAELAQLEAERTFAQIGKFRLGGEVHQWMYDQYSLGQLLTDAGFSDIQIHTATSSSISNWSSYELDTKHGLVRKPDSLFIEAIK
jgi:predicted SAM-dependent methyltransferase